METDYLSSYQNPEGTLKDRLAPRTDMRLNMIDDGWFDDRTVLDLGCNNGYFTRRAIKAGARRAVGVDVSDCIKGARILAEQENVGAEFWQMNLDSKEFRRYCPKFEVILLLSVITHLRDKEEFLDWLDDKIQYMLIFESNHGEANKEHIDLVTKHIYFDSVELLGRSEVEGKPHYMWVCRKPAHEIRYPIIASAPIEFIPLDKIIGWSEEKIMHQKTSYKTYSKKFKILKADIKSRGIRDPLIVEKRENNYFRGFQGVHRYLAAKELGYKELPCRVLKDVFFKHLLKYEA